MAITGVCSPAPNWRLRLASDWGPEVGASGLLAPGAIRDAIKFFRASLRALPAGIILGSTSILSAIKTQLHTELFGCLKGSLIGSAVYRTAGRPLVGWSHPNSSRSFSSASAFDHLYRYGLTGHYLASNLRSYLKASVARRATL